MSYQPYKTTISSGAGEVYVSLPEDGYIQLTPEAARKLASALFTHAAKAEGKEAPTMILLPSN